MSLNTQGIISAVTIAIYVPIFVLTLCISHRYGFTEKGWLLLVVFSLIRIVGGALIVAAELVAPAVTGLYIGGHALEVSGLSPLLLSTLGMIEIITEGPDKKKKHTHVFKILHIVGIVALILTIIGISNSSSGSATAERHAGVIIFAALCICLIIATVMQWANRYQLMRYRKQLLIAVSVALPFLAVRTLYSVLSSFSSNTSTTDSNSALAKFNVRTGEWQIYVVMEVVMEYVVVIIYTLAGTILRLDEDYGLQETDEYPLYRHRY